MLPLMLFTLYAIVLVISVYTLRHYAFSLNRLLGRQRHPYVDIDTAEWPTATVLIPAHNEEAVIACAIEALLDVDYPPEKLQIMPVNDRSTDRTREIVDQYAARYPGRITPFHRTGGKPGKAAAIKDATESLASEVLIIFDADYIPAHGLVKQLVAPFFDPEVGAVMGRVVPLNAGTNLLTRMLDLERSGGYQVDQQARMNMRLVPQFGGTTGALRRAAVESIGGWHDDVLAEDTDITYRLLLNGWKTVYQNRSECYEEVPETWPVRMRQITRWAKGHNQVFFRYALPLLRERRTGLLERIDGLFLLGVYIVPCVLLLGWLLCIALFYMGAYALAAGALALFAAVSYSSLGNFAVFFEIGTAVHLDGNRSRIQLLPFAFLNFLASVIAISQAVVQQLRGAWHAQQLQWDKTERFRRTG